MARGPANGSWTLDGDESIRKRPVDRIVDPLNAMNADISCGDDGRPPITVSGASLTGADHKLPIASAQVKSCLLLAGLLADGETTVIEPSPTRDHTERMLRAAGADLAPEDATTSVVIHGSLPAKRIAVRPGRELDLDRIEVPGDISSAAFILAAAVLVPGSEVRIEGVGLNPTRVGLLGILNRMGAALEVEEHGASGGEPRGAITARHGPLEATRVSGGEVPLAIDELPLIALLGCFAEGETVVSDAEELRHKESDRIATVVDGLAALGAEIEATEDGYVVTGERRARAAARSRRTATIAWRCWARSPASRRATASRSMGSRPPPSAIRASSATSARSPGAEPSASPGCPDGPRRARARAGAAGGRPRWRGPRAAPSGRRSPAGRGRR